MGEEGVEVWLEVAVGEVVGSLRRRNCNQGCYILGRTGGFQHGLGSDRLGNLKVVNVICTVKLEA